MDSYTDHTENLQGKSSDVTEIRQYLSLFQTPIELRIPITKVRTISGYFDDLESLVLTCKHLSGNSFNGAKIETIYTTLNPFKDDLVARSCNRLTDYAKHTTSDKDIVRRLWLPIDVDPVRPAGICANGLEKQAALASAHAVGQFLSDAGFPAPFAGDSGNGGHLLYRVDLDNSEEVKNTLMRFYEILARQFNTPDTTVDTTVYNAARIWKVYGTKVCKGDELGGRVHRLARIIHRPDQLDLVPHALIQKIVCQDTRSVSVQVVETPGPSRNGDGNGMFQHNLRLVERIMATASIGTMKEKEHNGGRLWVLDECPFCGNDDSSAHVEVQASGKLCFACKHNSCKSKYGWKDFRDKFGGVPLPLPS